MQNLSLSSETIRAIQIAQSIAKEYSNANFSPGHLLRAMLHKELSLRAYLETGGKDFYFMEDWADVRIEGYPKASKTEEPTGDDKINALFEEAENVRIKTSKDQIDLLCALTAIATPGIAYSYDQLKTLPVTVGELMSDTLEKASIQHAIGATQGGGQNKEASKTNNAIAKFCIDKTAQARDNKLDSVVGRDKETRMIIEILGRRSKPNVIIAGEPGVGKTAVVNGFAQNIVSGKVPDNFKNAIIFELDFGALIAGASYKGEIEDRLKNIITEIKQFEKAILFIDNIHNLLDKQGGASGASNILKPEMQKGEVTIIGTTTTDDYRKYIEADDAFNRLFELIRVEEPDETLATKMLKMVMPYFETHHNLKLNDDVILESVRLAKRYVKERKLPDAAIDLIDRTMSVVKMMGESSKQEITNLKAELETINSAGIASSDSNLNRNDEKELMKELKWFYNDAKNKVSSILFSQVEEEKGVDHYETSNEIKEHLKNLFEKLLVLSENKKEHIEKTDVAAVVSHKTGIPLGKLQAEERDKLMNMESILKKRVVGQDHGIKTICEAILESRSGLSRPGQPIGSFFLLGPTGTGKTELAKSLAEFLFNDENSMIRFDMSEFKEEHSAALLYGAPPGYVGYEEGGMLVNKIRQQPYTVVLFDEIEKAHPSVFDLFLQILDEGKLHDRLGKEGDFSNSVVLFTSNVGSDFVIESFGKGEIPKSTELMEIMSRFFRPEFLARLTEIVPFSPITEQIVVNIFNIQLNNFMKILNKQGIQLEVSDAAKEYLAKTGFTPKYGARPIAGVIRNQIRKPLSKKIIAGELSKGDTIKLDIDTENNLTWAK